MHTIEQGECLAEIALMYGFASGTQLYHHPDNEALRRKRPDPNLLLPGDRIAIPDPDQKTVPASTESLHRFKKVGLTKPLRVELRDPEENRFAQREYELRVPKSNGVKGDNLMIKGKLDAEGRLEERVPVDAKKAVLIVFLEDQDYELDLLIDHLDPVDEPTGIQGRLKNLGFDCGPVDGKVGPRTRDALRAYQAKKGLAVTGEANQETQDALQAEHKS